MHKINYKNIMTDIILYTVYTKIYYKGGNR